MAVVLGVISSVLLVLGLFDTLDRLRTPAMREVVDDFLAEAPGSSLGVDTAQVVEWMRGLTFVSGALAATGLVFAIFVLQRHRGARIGFTVVAALLLLTVPVAGLMPFFLAVAAFLMWSQPARDWYVGRVPVAAGAGRPTHHEERQPMAGSTPFPPPPGRPDEPRRDPAPDPSHDRPQDEPQEQAQQWAAPQQSYDPPQSYGPPPYGQTYGDPQQGYYGPSDPQQGYYGQPYGPPGHGATAYGAGPGRDPDKRPVTVTIAAVLTWIGAGVTALLMLVFVAVLGTGGDAFVEEFERAARESDVTLSADEVLAVGWAIAGVFLVWSLISLVLAVLAFRRSNGARYALAVSAVMTALLSLVAIMSVLSVVTLLMGGAAAILLFTGGANQWYAGRSNDRAGGPPSYYAPGYPGYPVAGQQPSQPSQQPGPQPQQPQGRNQPW